jgi:hypothetical protein
VNRQQWVARVASHAAADLGASTSDEVVYEYNELSAADQDRVDWAIDHVRRRLYRMGRQE